MRTMILHRLIAILPILLLAMLAILVESGLPVFYRQERVGQGGKTFTILKLRSMRQDAEKDGKPKWAGAQDSRITRVGQFLRRTRIDELPQLFNVLRGDIGGRLGDAGHFIDLDLHQVHREPGRAFGDGGGAAAEHRFVLVGGAQ